MKWSSVINMGQVNFSNIERGQYQWHNSKESCATGHVVLITYSIFCSDGVSKML